jgi:ribosomal protein S12 methylthiotransferase accessory factor
MLKKPKFKNCFKVITVKSVGVFLLSEIDYYVLTGKLYELLAPLINGERTPEELIGLVAGKASAAEVFYALMLMEQKDYIVESEELLPSEIASLCDLLQIDRQAAGKCLKTTKVAVKACGNIDPKPFVSILKNQGILIAEEGDITAVLTDDYLQEGLENFNQKSLAEKRPWMLIKPIGTIMWLGPIFAPGKTACWECLAQRVRSNRPVETFIQSQLKISQPLITNPPKIDATVSAGLNLAATEILKWVLRGEHKTLEENLITINTNALKTERHAAIKRPQCPACGEEEYRNQSPKPVILESNKKTFTSDGGHRSSSPEETIEKYEKQVSPITGVVRQLTPLKQESFDKFTYSYVAGHNFATMFDSLYFLRENVRGKSGGKGQTEIQAKASALGEAIERYSGVYQGYEIRKTATYKELGDGAIHPNRCTNYSEEQYRTRQEWNENCKSSFQRVAEPFEEDVAIEWTPVWSLTNETWKYVPTAYCYYGYRDLPKQYFWADSNGAAAGNTKEEAILQGFMELVERDSVSMWWYNRIRRPGVDLDSFDEPYFQKIRDYYRSINREIWVLDLASDFGIPTFAGVSRRTDSEIEDIIYGFGAHFDPKIAIGRALTEVNQCLPAVISRQDDGSTKYIYDDDLAIDWWKRGKAEEQSYVLPAEGELKARSDYPKLATDDIKDDVLKCADIAKSLGLETLVLDQTRPDIGLNVVKVFIPETRIFWKRWGPGRLYDVPVKLGWLPKPHQESELNPFLIFF